MTFNILPRAHEGEARRDGEVTFILALLLALVFAPVLGLHLSFAAASSGPADAAGSVVHGDLSSSKRARS